MSKNNTKNNECYFFFQNDCAIFWTAVILAVGQEKSWQYLFIVKENLFLSTYFLLEVRKQKIFQLNTYWP